MSRMTVGKLERKIAALQAKADEFAAMAEHSQSKVVRKISAFMAKDALEQIKPWQEKLACLQERLDREHDWREWNAIQYERSEICSKRS
jgi:hypothetical protein